MTVTKFKTRTEMAEEFGVDRKTFNTMLKKHHIELPKGLISPAYQQYIYEVLGAPKEKAPK